MANAFVSTYREPGTYTSLRLQSGRLAGKETRLYFDLTDQDLRDPELNIVTVIQATDQNGNVSDAAWRTIQSDDWWGGNIGKDGNPIRPDMGFSISGGDAVQQVRVKYTVNKEIRIGIDLEVRDLDASSATVKKA